MDVSLTMQEFMKNRVLIDSEAKKEVLEAIDKIMPPSHTSSYHADRWIVKGCVEQGMMPLSVLRLFSRHCAGQNSDLSVEEVEGIMGKLMTCVKLVAIEEEQGISR